MRQKSQEFVSSSTTKNERIAGKEFPVFQSGFLHFSPHIQRAPFALKTCCESRDAGAVSTEGFKKTTRHERSSHKKRKKKRMRLTKKSPRILTKFTGVQSVQPDFDLL